MVDLSIVTLVYQRVFPLNPIKSPYGDLMGFHGDLMGFHGDLMGFHGDLMGFQVGISKSH